jgi:hypothetical protein
VCLTEMLQTNSLDGPTLVPDAVGVDTGRYRTALDKHPPLRGVNGVLLQDPTAQQHRTRIAEFFGSMGLSPSAWGVDGPLGCVQDLHFSSLG